LKLFIPFRHIKHRCLREDSDIEEEKNGGRNKTVRENRRVENT
jgi:hypothetical protein